MTNLVNLRYYKFLIMIIMSFFIAFSNPISLCARTQEEEKRIEVSCFDELTSSLSQIQSTGGTIILTQDITVPADESYVYNNGRYRKEVVIETQGHTIYVEGYLDLWPFLTICGDGSKEEIFHVYPGGELRLVSVCIDAGKTGIAVVQEEGAFLMYGSEESMNLPAFSCIGQILSPQTITAAAYWRYNCEKLPVVRVPDGEDFTADMLPDKVMSIVNRDHREYEEEISVIWDETTFPTERVRTLVRGEFTDEYSHYKDYIPQCLVVWESDTSPFFLNVYLKSVTQWYDMVFMYGESPKAGTVYIQSSNDGKNWKDISGTDGYAPVETEKNSSFLWMLSYDLSVSEQVRPKYYRLLQISDDGTEFYSDALELSSDFIFTAADIEGGRGGETSPNEGENQLSDNEPEIDNENESVLDESSTSDLSLDQELDIELNNGKETQDKLDNLEGDNATGNTDESTNSKDNTASAGTSCPNNDLTEAQVKENEETIHKSDSVNDFESEKNSDKQLNSDEIYDKNLYSTNTDKIVGIVIVVCILICSVLFFVFKGKR